jgi:hypothetical protein
LVVATLASPVAGCFPSFDGLSGSEKDAASGVQMVQGDGSSDVAMVQSDGSSDVEMVQGDGSSSRCIDSAHYPGGGFYKVVFDDVSDMVLNGGAASVAGVLRLAGVDGAGVGSAYTSSPVPFDSHTSFFVHFVMRIGGGAGEMGTDGMAFVVQSSPMGAKAIGIGGGGLGYETVTPSLAVEFDTFQNPTDPAPNEVALLANGDPHNHIAYAVPPFILNDGVPRDVWIDYDWTVDLIEVYMGEGDARPAQPLFKHNGAPLIGMLGNQVYMGASAATGSSQNDHELHGKTWFVTSPLPKCR